MATAPGQEPVPWYVRWTRWRQTSRQEAQAAEQALLSQCSRTYQVADVRVGPTDRHYMHMIHGARALQQLAASCQGSQHYSHACMHAGGPEGGTPVVVRTAALCPPKLKPALMIAMSMQMLPGYGAGAGFFWRYATGAEAHRPSLCMRCPDLEVSQEPGRHGRAFPGILCGPARYVCSRLSSSTLRSLI